MHYCDQFCVYALLITCHTGRMHDGYNTAEARFAQAKDTGGALVAAMSLLLVALVFSVFCHHWSTAASAIICEAVRRESTAAESSCQPVQDSGLTTPSLSESCAARTQSDGAKVMYNNSAYSISGLQNFSVNGSYVGYCPSGSDPNGDEKGGCVGTKNIPTYYVEHLRINYSPVGMKLYKATLSWNYFKNNPTPVNSQGEDIVKAYRLWVTAPSIKHPGYCVCINSTINMTEYSLILEYKPSVQLSASIYTFPFEFSSDPLNPPEGTVKRCAPDNCTDYGAGVPYTSSACNMPYYGKPRNVKVDRNATHTTLSWDKPCYQDTDACHLLMMDESSSPRSGPDTYYLTATVNGLPSHFVIYNAMKVTLTTPGPVDFKLYTHTPCSGGCDDSHFENCSQPAISVGEPDDGTCCSPTPSLSLSMSPTHTMIKDDPISHPNSWLIVSLSISVVAILVVVVFFLVILLVIRKTCTARPLPHPYPVIPPPPPPCPVLVGFSLRTCEQETRAILQCLVSDLTSYSIESSTYGMSQLRQNQSEWVVEQHEKASAILCVCNQEFFEDWTNTFADSNSDLADCNPLVVRTLKQLFEGDMQRGESGTDNYAVIKMKPTDDRFIPPLLRHRPAYMYDEVERIARFVHNVPQYCL